MRWNSSGTNGYGFIFCHPEERATRDLAYGPYSLFPAIMIVQKVPRRSLLGMTSMLVPRRIRSVATAASAWLALATTLVPPACAQGFPASQRARVEQTVAFTDISV